MYHYAVQSIFVHTSMNLMMHYVFKNKYLCSYLHVRNFSLKIEIARVIVCYTIRKNKSHQFTSVFLRNK